MLLGASVIGFSPAPSETPRPTWTDWELVSHTDGEEAQIYSLRVVSGHLDEGWPHQVELCIAPTVYLCGPEAPPQFTTPGSYVVARLVLDRPVMQGQTWGFHPVPAPPQTMIWARVYAVHPPRMLFRFVYGGAYGWSEPEDSWEVTW
jgi:hypothetical protein